MLGQEEGRCAGPYRVGCCQQVWFAAAALQSRLPAAAEEAGGRGPGAC